MGATVQSIQKSRILPRTNLLILVGSLRKKNLLILVLNLHSEMLRGVHDQRPLQCQRSWRARCLYYYFSYLNQVGRMAAHQESRLSQNHIFCCRPSQSCCLSSIDHTFPLLIKPHKSISNRHATLAPRRINRPFSARTTISGAPADAQKTRAL